MYKFLVGLAASAGLAIVPALIGNPAALQHPQLWILIGVGLLASLTQPAYKPIDRDAPPEDHGTSAQIVWTTYLTLCFGVLEAVFFRYPESFVWDALTTTALVLAVAGALFRAWAVATLGNFFTWHVRIQKGQTVVSSGPYRFVRHPSYTGAIVLYVCTMLVIKAWIGAALVLVFLTFAFVRRIRYEEDLLISALGDEYISYSRNLKRLVPSLW
jgi:protein-S-isoprenylcysteine O-methyltransferase